MIIPSQTARLYNNQTPDLPIDSMADRILNADTASLYAQCTSRFYKKVAGNIVRHLIFLSIKYQAAFQGYISGNDPSL